MPEEQSQAKPYIFTLYPEDNEAIDEFASAHCRGNRSEAVRRMISFTISSFPAAVRPVIIAETYIAHPEAEVHP